MKPQPLILQIPEPCHENWDSMQTTGCGRHCAACEKTVVDFTGFSDELLLNYFKRNAGQEICGRILPSQINRPIVKAKNRTGWGWYAKIAATLLAIQASAVTVLAQKAKRPTTTVNATPDVLPNVVSAFRKVLVDPTKSEAYNVNRFYGGVISYSYPIINSVAKLDPSLYKIHGNPVPVTPLPAARPSLFKRIKYWFKK